MALNAQEIINYIADSPKKTPVKIYVNLSAPVDFGSAEVFGEGKSRIVFVGSARNTSGRFLRAAPAGKIKLTHLRCALKI